MTDQRDAIAELLMGRVGGGYEGMPQSENIEDRRPYDPLQAFVDPAPVKLPASYQLKDLTRDEQREYLRTMLEGDPAVKPTYPQGTPGRMPKGFEMRPDIDRYTRELRLTPPSKLVQPEQFGGPTERMFDPFSTAMTLGSGYHESPMRSEPVTPYIRGRR